MSMSHKQFEALLAVIKASSLHARIALGAIIFRGPRGTNKVNVVTAYKEYENAQDRARQLLVEPFMYTDASEYIAKFNHVGTMPPPDVVTRTVYNDVVRNNANLQRRIETLEKKSLSNAQLLEINNNQRNFINELKEQKESLSTQMQAHLANADYWHERAKCEERQADAAKAWVAERYSNSWPYDDFIKLMQEARNGELRKPTGPAA